MAIVSCTLPLPTKPVEIFVVVISIQVEASEEPTIPKPIPLIILEIRIGTKVILIDSITHAFEVFRTLNMIFKDTHVIERPKSQSVFLAKTY